MFEKITLIILSALIISQVPLAAQAGYKEGRDYYLGEIKAVNRPENSITIFDYIDNRVRTFFVEKGVGQDLKPGLEVMIITLKGADTAKRVNIIVHRSIDI